MTKRDLPTGKVTLLFTDIEGSTKLLRRLGNAYVSLLDRHRDLVRQAIAAGGGTEMGTAGDSFYAVFPDARDAVAAATEMQRALAAETWPEGSSVRVRMGVHTGEPRLVDGSYVGLDIHRTARIASSASGGQLVVSAATAEVLRNRMPSGTTLRPLGEHRLRDMPEPDQLFQVVIDGLPSQFPALRTEVVAAHNLPAPLTSFVGRARELGEVTDLLGSHHIVTLTGPGGSGKTRFGLEVARAAMGRFPDGVWLVELAPVADPWLVPEVVASSIGIQAGASRTLLDALTEFLAPRTTLIVLDNCEHQLAECAQLTADLITACPDLTVLATSREPLGVRGENVYVVPALPVPGRDDSLDLAHLREIDGVRLFEERSQAARATFRLTEENAAAVAEVVRRLDGIPLAIELAAARVKLLSPAQLADRLAQRFDFLHGGPAAISRHQTLTAVMDWSHELLAEEERLALQRLSIFRGGCSLEAAEEVLAGDGIDVHDVIALMASLVDKSLIVAGERDGEARFSMLETVRHYARERLDKTGADDVASRHQRWCVDLAEDAYRDFWTDRMPRLLDDLETEHDNIRAALDWTRDTTSVGEALRIAGALWPFWDVRGYLRQGRQQIEQLLARPESAEVALEVRARAMDSAAWMCGLQGDLSTAMQWAEQALELWRRTGNQVGTAWSLILEGNQLYNLADADGAAAAFEEGMALGDSAGDVMAVGWAHFGLGHTSWLRGDAVAAQQHLQQALELSEQRNVPWGVAWARFSLGILALFLGDLDRATSDIRETLRIRWALGDRRTLADSLVALASLAGLSGRAAEAAELLGASESVREATGAGLLPWLEPMLQQGMAQAEEALGTTAFEAARNRGKTMPTDRAIAQAVTVDPEA